MSDLESIKLELTKVSCGIALSMIFNIVLYLMSFFIIYYYIYKYVCEEIDNINWKYDS